MSKNTSYPKKLSDYSNFDYLDSLEGLPHTDPPKVNRLSIAYAKILFPGLACVMTISLAAIFLAGHYTAPAVFFALLLGLAVNFLSQIEDTRAGLDFAAKDLLRIGIAISGAQITFQEIQSLGLNVAFGVLAVVALTFFSGIVLARLFGLQKELGVLAGGAVSICGASAALAVSAVLPQSKTLERNTIFIIVCVATLSTIAMIAYPLISLEMKHTDIQSGLFFGGSIHDVAQVLAAGYSVSDTAGEVATVTKLLRVALLFPIVSLIAIYFSRRMRANEEAQDGKGPPKIPFFLVAFLIVVALNSFGAIPDLASGYLSQGARICLVLAVAALGVKTSFEALREIGMRPLLMVVTQTVFMAALMLGFITLRG